MKKIIVDIDGTICTNTDGEYEKAVPFKENIVAFNKLYEKGYKITYFTARGTSTGKDWTELTTRQLNEWGALYHELIMNKKPSGDLYVDDKASNIEDFMLIYRNLL